MSDSSQIDVSIVVPAKNEEARLPGFLNELIRYCRNDPGRKHEIIVVDDGSSDRTSELVRAFRKDFEDLQVIRLPKNMGKGRAVKEGLLASRGKIALFLDADGSTQPGEIKKNLHFLDEGFDIVIGSRVIGDAPKRIKARFHRRVIGFVFNSFVQQLLFKEIKDTQCGFKMFKKNAVAPIFSRVRLDGFGFDIEVLYLASRMNYKIKEVPVDWQHKKGSKINLLLDSSKMFVNILQIRNWHGRS